mmetsp:Transcript_1336/g.2919  ORF Transcript_1336/g.2919 Transcript_1336/m.2919 type:complete len:300 (-) Transcript_1336:375-1274(-)
MELPVQSTSSIGSIWGWRLGYVPVLCLVSRMTMIFACLIALGDLQLAARGDDHRPTRGTIPTAYHFDRSHDFLSFHDLAEDDMLRIEMRGCSDSQEKLRPVRIGACICHREQVWLRMAYVAVVPLVVESVPVDRLSSRPVPVCKVSALAHERGDHTVEGAALVVQRLPAAALALLSRAQGAEVLTRLRDDLIEKLHLNPPSCLIANRNVKEDTNVPLFARHFLHRQLWTLDLLAFAAAEGVRKVRRDEACEHEGLRLAEVNAEERVRRGVLDLDDLDLEDQRRASGDLLPGASLAVREL